MDSNLSKIGWVDRMLAIYWLIFPTVLKIVPASPPVEAMDPTESSERKARNPVKAKVESWPNTFPKAPSMATFPVTRAWWSFAFASLSEASLILE